MDKQQGRPMAAAGGAARQLAAVWLTVFVGVVVALPARSQPAAAPTPAHATTPTAPVAENDVPFVVTPDNVTLAMLELAAVGPRDHVIDLGSGDGRIPILAARRFGASGLGVEIVPELVRRSRESAARADVADRVRFVEQDLFATDLRPATVITLYLLPQINLQLRPRLLALAPGTRIVSHDWDMGDWAPDRSIVVEAPDKKVGREKLSRLHLWHVPARVQGRWCAGERPALQLTQHYQRYEGSWLDGRVAPPPGGRIEGARLRPDGGAAAWQTDGEDVLRDPAGTVYRRC